MYAREFALQSMLRQYGPNVSSDATGECLCSGIIINDHHHYILHNQSKQLRFVLYLHGNSQAEHPTGLLQVKHPIDVVCFYDP